MEEIWKDVIGYEGHYKVSNLGSIKSLSRIRKAGEGYYKTKEIILKQSTSTNKRLTINLSKENITKTRLVHQLVAESFLGHISNGLKLVIDHIDDNYLNNKVDNLQIVTQRFNARKTQGRDSSKYKGVHWCKRSKKWRATIRINKNKKHLGLFICELEAHKAYQNKLKEII